MNRANRCSRFPSASATFAASGIEGRKHLTNSASGKITAIPGEGHPMTTRLNRHRLSLMALLILGMLLLATAHAGEPDRSPTETAGGWVKHPKNPVLGGDLGTCFDISVLKERDTYRMWFSWRPKKSIALVESQNGVDWTKP